MHPWIPATAPTPDNLESRLDNMNRIVRFQRSIRESVIRNPMKACKSTLLTLVCHREGSEHISLVPALGAWA